jgi:hypothetical protein
MSWKSLLSGSVAGAAVAMFAITLLTPTASRAQTQTDCGQNDGLLCRKRCERTCGTTTVCCDEVYFYYPKVKT